MSKRRKSNRRKEIEKPPTRRGFLLAAVVLAVLTLGMLALWWSRSPAGDANLAADPSATNGVAGAGDAIPAFQKLVGKWVRPDGGYVVEIKSADSTGKLDAGYFNPNPIRVARAEASAQGSMLKVFIELRDMNYPGSTYTLAYDPAKDQLTGIYYQAAIQQQFEVFFERLK